MKNTRARSLLTVSELATYLNLKKQTIYNWINKGKISGIKMGKVWRFEKEEIEDWLKGHRKKVVRDENEKT